MLALIREMLATPAILVGLVTLLGLLLQKKSVDHIVKGTVVAIVGFILLSIGSEVLQKGALRDFGILFNYDFRIQGVVPNMEAVSSMGIARYATEVSLVMLCGMMANVIMARFGPFPYIFLTGHHTLYMACLLTIVLDRSGMARWQIIVSGSLILGLLMALMPALAQREMVKITGSNKLALGHFSTLGYLAAAGAAHLVTHKKTEKKEAKYKSTEEIRFPQKLSFMRESTVSIFVVMLVLFLIVTGIAAAQTDLNRLDIAYRTEFQNWVVYALIQAAEFSACIYIILAGVRLVIAEIVPAFKGIAKKIVPHAKPAVDCPVLFSYASNAVMIGFLMSFLGGVVTMFLLLAINRWHMTSLIPVIVPGVAAHFFCGGTAGVFANAEGGVKGCVIGSFFHGILISLLALFVMPVLGTLNLSGTSFSDADFCAVGILFGNLAEVLKSSGMCILCVLCFVLPIIITQIKKQLRTVKK